MVNDCDKERDGRSRPAHLANVARFNTPVILFVTVCAADRAVNTFANEAMRRILREAWESAGSHKVGAYVLMPDHLHLFCAPASPEAENVAKWVRYWKSLSTRAVRGRPVGGASVGLPARSDEQTLVPPGVRRGMRSGEGQASACPPVFQRDCWDTQLRRGENYRDKWDYVRNNPVRRGLVGCAEEWPYWGIMNDLAWRDGRAERGGCKRRLARSLGRAGARPSRPAAGCAKGRLGAASLPMLPFAKGRVSFA